MKDPQRYIAKAVIRPRKNDDTYDVEAVSDSNGDWVAWEDYAKLKDDAERYRLASLRGDVAHLENARLNADMERVRDDRLNQGLLIQALTSERDYLKKEVERLKDAGDRLCDKEFVETMGDYEFDSEAYAIRIRNWHKAKEGNR